MALKITLQSNNSACINKMLRLQGDEDCLYLKITQQSGNAKYCGINVSCFACKEVNLENKESYNDQIGTCINNMSYSFIPDLLGDNFIKQGYEYLKTLPEFADCIDC